MDSSGGPSSSNLQGKIKRSRRGPRAYDRAAIKFGTEAGINFSVSDYDEDIKQMSHFTEEEFVHILRCQSNGFVRGRSKYRGVALHKCGRWEARMGQLLGKKRETLSSIYTLAYLIARLKLQEHRTRLRSNAMEGEGER